MRECSAADVAADCFDLGNRLMEYDPETFDVERFLIEHDLGHGSPKPRHQGNAPVVNARKWDMPGFHGRARVTTNFGDLPIMGLRVRDRVRTITGEYKPVQWIDEIRLDETFLDSFPEAQPIRIGKGAIGNSSPQAEVLLSPAQELILKKEWALSETKSAGELLLRPNVFRTRESSVSYFVFHCGGADVVKVEGIWCHVSPPEDMPDDMA